MRVRWKKSHAAGKSVDTGGGGEVEWHGGVTRSAGLKALELVRTEGLPPTSWGAAALYGHWVRCYEERYRRQVTLTAEGSRTVLDTLESLRDRLGDDIAKAVSATFALRWVKADHLSFLMNESNYHRFVIPEMEKSEPKRGEQSEWQETEGPFRWR